MKRIPLINVVGLLLVGLVAGCSSAQESRIDKNREIYETWPLDTRQAVLDGKVEQGMTPEMVKVSWGEPTKVVSSDAANEEIWIYEKGGSDGMMMDPGIAMGTTPLVDHRGNPIMGQDPRLLGAGMGTPGVGMNPAPIYTAPVPPEVRE